jgi:DNA-binding GntR family transcriptional regulator
VPEPEIIYDGPVPVYQQVAARLRAQIESGQLKRDQALPSESDICQRYGVGRSTARRAVAQLRDEGIVYTVPQRGSFVGKEPPGA